MVELMFGKELAPPVKPKTCREDVALRLENVVLTTDRLRVTVGDFEVREGEVIGLAGLEGSGQQVLLQFCAGLLKASSGRISVDGIDMTEKPYQSYLNAGIGYSPADRLREGLIRGLTIHEHVSLRTPQKVYL